MTASAVMQTEMGRPVAQVAPSNTTTLLGIQRLPGGRHNARLGLAGPMAKAPIAWLAPYDRTVEWSSNDTFPISVMEMSWGVGAVVVPLMSRRHLDGRPWSWLCIASRVVGLQSRDRTIELLPNSWTVSGLI